MRLDLSSQITLERVPKKYYKPDNDFEEYNLARYEKLPVAIYEEARKAAIEIANDISKEIQRKEKEGKPFIFGISGGVSPVPVYEELVRLHKEEGLSFKNVVVYNTYEFYPVLDFSFSNLQMLKDVFLDKVDIDPTNINSPDATVEKELIGDVCEKFEKKLEILGGLDYLLLGLGRKGNVGFNMPGSSLHSQTRMVMLDGDSRADISHNFGSLDKVPVSAITMGLYDMMESKKITLLAWGEQKAESIRDIVEGAVLDSVPGSVLQTHPEATVYVDIAAAAELTRLSKPWLVTNCEWDSKLIRRAIVWLCGVVDKPILKLTN
ncbi:MAG TPA: glucosamine-6-phosphate deaminase, partial [Bacteroidales bacterium]|nr:glucosamine-6-phosphate deaminase [Bacteroidales bacterium]